MSNKNSERKCKLRSQWSKVWTLIVLEMERMMQTSAVTAQNQRHNWTREDGAAVDSDTSQGRTELTQ